MPPISRVDPDQKYKELSDKFLQLGDNRFCVPLGIAILTGLDPEKVREAMNAYGRRDRRGVHRHMTRSFICMLGYNIKDINPKSIINEYRNPQNYQSVTSHHPRRFPSVWKGRSYLMFSKGHCLAVVDGVTKDWSVNRSLVIKEIWALEETLNFPEMRTEILERIISGK
jgi:hypothetical protein